MILLALLASVTIPLPPAQKPAPTPEAHYQSCIDQTKSDPVAAATAADTWRVNGGGWPASQCLGLAYVAQEKWPAAEAAFEQAAQTAEERQDGRAGNLWAQAGNAALAGDDPSKARMAFDRALALPVLSQLMQGEAWMDRARADVMLNDLPAARTDLDKATSLAAADPMAWLLSATLARRQRDYVRAAKDIGEAENRAPGDPDVDLERGRIALAQGDATAARADWQKAHDADPNGPTGQQASALIDALPPGPPATPAKH